VVRLAVRLLRTLFRALESGSLVVHDFYPEWAVPTYKLSRTLLQLFLRLNASPAGPSVWWATLAAEEVNGPRLLDASRRERQSAWLA
jgi:hypothetical protein